MVCTRHEDMPALEALLERGRANGVPELRIVGREELVRMEPNISDEAVAALWAPTAGICDPFALTAALAESAATNGVGFRFNARVTAVEPATLSGGAPGWKVKAGGATFFSRVVINAAGVYADQIHNMVSADTLTITPRPCSCCPPRWARACS